MSLSSGRCPIALVSGGSCDVVLKIATFKCKMTKGMSRIETTGPAQADLSAGTQISAERLAMLSAYP
ncbi:hypothetical protein V6N13_053404 [Hibiscus sabdariffa]